MRRAKILETIAQGMTDGILVISTDYRIRWANSAALTQNGCDSMDKIIGNFCYKVTHHRESPCTGTEEPCPLAELQKGGKIVTVEHCHFDSSGHKAFVEVTAFPINDEKGNLLEFIDIHRDVTAQKRMQAEKRNFEDQLLQSQRMEVVGKLAGGIAHDFNNILMGVIGFTDLALEQVPENTQLREDLILVKKQGLRAADLTRKLLAFSRKQVLERRNVDLNQVVLEMQNFIKRVIRSDVELQVDTAVTPCVAYVDPAQFEQVLLNLCANARDAMPQGGKITISTRTVDLNESYCQYHASAKPGQWVEVSVIDTGTGMSEEVASHVFEPFFTTKKAGDGTGLGLAMVHGIVNQHGGFIDLETTPGKGTAFKIYFEAVLSEPEGSAHDSTQIPRGGNETVLVVDDETIVREMAGRSLEPYGYKVLKAGDGYEAKSIFEANHDQIHLVILDIVMPKLGGWDVFLSLRNINKGVKFLFMSGYSGGAGQAVMQSGVNFISKPFTCADLAKKIREVLDSPADNSRQLSLFNGNRLPLSDG